MVLHPELKIKPALKVQKLQFLDWPLEASSRSEGNSHVKKRSFTAEQSMFTTMDSVDRCRCSLLEHISVPLEAFRVFFFMELSFKYACCVFQTIQQTEPQS